MSEKKKLDENQIWSTIIMVIPVVFLGQIGGDVGTNLGMSSFYGAALGGGIGGLIGALGSQLSKDKSRLIKIIATIGVIATCALVVTFIPSKATEQEVVKQDWVQQQIGEIAFNTPTELTSYAAEIPENVKELYRTLKTYTDQNDDKVTMFLNMRLTTSSVALTDTVAIENTFLGSLEGMLNSISVDLSKFEMEPLQIDEETVSTTFSFEVQNSRVSGYGFMFKKGDVVDIIWLLPVKKGFSKEYIDKFKEGIMINPD